jgi:hypothetical protein
MRADGKRVKDIEPMYALISYIMDKRYDAMNFITLDIPLDPIKKYMNECRKVGKEVSHMAIIIAAYLRAAAEFPWLNRFIMNKKVYARNEFTVGMVVLRGGRIDQQGTMSKMYLTYEDDVFRVQEIINEYVGKNRETPQSNPTEKLMKILLSIPLLPNLAIGLFKFMDRHGLLPRAVIEASPFHCSLLISNLASIRTNHIYHHTYEFGTTSIAITMGNSRMVPKEKGGEIVFEKCMPLGVVMDERICSGSYFAMAFRRIKSYLEDPTQLEGPPKIINQDA